MIKRFCDICNADAPETEFNFRHGEIGFTHLCYHHQEKISRYVISLRSTEGIWKKEKNRDSN